MGYTTTKGTEMTAAGKITASNVQVGDRIVVKISRNDAGLIRGILQSSTKTGQDVIVARVIGKNFRAAQGSYERQGRYIVETTVGDFEAAPSQTMWLAPEDAAGIKRAHAEALTENADRDAAAERVAQATSRDSYQAAWNSASQTVRDAAGTAESNRAAGYYADALWHLVELIHAEAVADNNASESQMDAWAARGGFDWMTPRGWQAGLEADHAEALEMDTAMSTQASVDQIFDWINSHGYRGALTGEAVAGLVDASHAEALEHPTEQRPAGLCLRGTGVHVGHMSAVVAECREDESESDTLALRQPPRRSERAWFDQPSGYAQHGAARADGSHSVWGLPNK